MNKLILSLISYPIFLGPLLMGVHSVSAKEFVFEAETNSNSTNSTATCVSSNTNTNINTNNTSTRFNPTCHRVKKEHQKYVQSPNGNNPYNDLVDDFSEEESNASVALFGCDCPICINALRQLRSLSSVNNS
jgi:hypothetical protein